MGQLVALLDTNVIYPPALRDMLIAVALRGLVAAALKGGASVIVTDNLKHFHPMPAGLSPMLPDAFLCQFLNRTDELLECLDDVRESWPEPPPLKDLLDRLSKLVPQFAYELRAAI